MVWIRRIAFVLLFSGLLIAAAFGHEEIDFYFGWTMFFGAIYFMAALWIRLLEFETNVDVRAHRIGLAFSAAVFPVLLLLVDRVWDPTVPSFHFLSFVATAIAFKEIERAMDRKVQREAAAA